ncbi:MAG: hypothetical protein RM049_23440 [Nostoc sp. DedQUE04]|uniref:hypothetical protein n=1 Tax=Nostoc sp. DedQUE04 TaxID=3075390 RepID=UPI002AD4A845|nr:hypothetical protein [Nostoc sp. DedQUE04]MDZ8138224.1 hypothetical protein [Nostoc sp. DedQUE04]
MMIDSEQKISIRTALRDSRREGLINFMEDLIELLHQEGYSFQDLLEALAGWVDRQQPSPDLTVKHLEEAAMELSRFSKNRRLNN